MFFLTTNGREWVQVNEAGAVSLQLHVPAVERPAAARAFLRQDRSRFGSASCPGTVAAVVLCRQFLSHAKPRSREGERRGVRAVTGDLSAALGSPGGDFVARAFQPEICYLRFLHR